MRHTNYFLLLNFILFFKILVKSQILLNDKDSIFKFDFDFNVNYPSITYNPDSLHLLNGKYYCEIVKSSKKYKIFFEINNKMNNGFWTVYDGNGKIRLIEYYNMGKIEFCTVYSKKQFILTNISYDQYGEIMNQQFFNKNLLKNVLYRDENYKIKSKQF